MFAGAFGILKAAIEYVQPAVDAVWASLLAAVDWIVSTAVPAVGEFFADAWATLLPVPDSVGEHIGTLYSSVLSPLVSWIVGTAVSASMSVTASPRARRPRQRRGPDAPDRAA